MQLYTVNVDLGVISDTSTTHTHPLFEIPAKAYVIDVFARVKTAVVGITTPTVKVGTSTQTDLYVIEQPINVTGDLMSSRSRGRIPWCSVPKGYQNAEAKIQIIATYTSGSEAWSSMSAGEIEFICIYAL